MFKLQAPSVPKIREDLTLHVGPPDPHGAPTWTIHDPVRNQYFSIDWISFEVLSRLDLDSVESILYDIQSSTTLNPSEDDVTHVFEFLIANELSVESSDQTVKRFMAKDKAKKQNFWQFLLHHYLFFRLPLFKPDKQITYLAKHTGFFYSRKFFIFTALAFLWAVVGVLKQFEDFQKTLIDTFSWSGLMAYGLAIVVAKILHEFGHAITAKRFGCQVPTMGVAFLVMFPMAYTDVTQAWKLSSHRQRLLISASGILTELIIAIWCLLLWTVLPEGAIKSSAFFLATTSLIATLIINSSPFMRFDGYFLLCDMLGMPNLHQRASATSRWWLREKLFQLGDASPEEMPKHRQQFLVVFAAVTWLYRLGVFWGIALMVYHYFYKPLGFLLFLIEIWYFIFKPIFVELKYWQTRSDEILPVFQKKPVKLFGLILAALLILPINFSVGGQGLLKPEKSFAVVLPGPAMLMGEIPRPGHQFKEGDLIINTWPSDVARQYEVSQEKEASLSWQVSTAGFDSNTRNRLSILQEQYASAQSTRQGLEEEYLRYQPHAPFDGVLIDVDPDLHENQWMPKNSHLMTLINPKSWIVVAYVEESDAQRIFEGAWGKFRPETIDQPILGLKVLSIEKDATRVIKDEVLSNVAGGQIMVRESNGKLVPERAIYRVILQVDSHEKPSSMSWQRGSVSIYGWPTSILWGFFKSLVATVIRESGI